MAHGRLGAVLPSEHGAWAMLTIPFLLGTLEGDPSWVSWVLLVAWIATYGASFFGLRWYRTRHRSHRGKRYRGPAIAYAVIAVVGGAVVLWQQPWVFAAIWLFVPFEAVVAWYALHGNERSWVAGVAATSGASLMAPLAYRVADGDDVTVAATLFLVSWFAFTGTVLHVKSTIRERNNPRFRQASIGFHAVGVVVTGLLEPWLIIPFGFLLVRSAAVPQKGWRPGRIGIVEIVGSALVLVVTLWAV